MLDCMFTRRPAARPLALVLVASLAACLAVPGLLFAQDEPIKKDVPYVPTPQEVVDRMLEMARVIDKDVVYDLGCGDGRMVITAAKKYGARGVGVDIDPQRIKESNENAKKSGVTDKVKFIQADLFKMDFDDATVLTLYLLPSVNEKLRPKILQLKPGTRVVSHSFDMGEWEPDDRADINGRTAYYWTVPARVDGSWQATMKEGGKDCQVALNLQQKYQNVAGTAEVDGKRVEIRDAKLEGDRLTFALAADGQDTRTYTCRIDGGKMEGRAAGGAGADTDEAQAASWVARREGGGGQQSDQQQRQRREQRPQQPAGID